ncbi:MAG: hypothetical protein JNM56_23475, partial [Planctomycetia bacterium]|nr:hypothetical protein [Planctomycetia bacterium]
MRWLPLYGSIYLASLLVALHAADAPPKNDKPIAFKGAKIHTAAGAPIERGTLVVHQGKIVAVGPDADTPIPAGAEVRDV